MILIAYSAVGAVVFVRDLRRTLGGMTRAYVRHTRPFYSAPRAAFMWTQAAVPLTLLCAVTSAVWPLTLAVQAYNVRKYGGSDGEF